MHGIPAHRERRSRQRFSIGLPVTYHVLPDARLSGSGIIVDISSSGVHFTTATALPLGAQVILTVPWPMLLHDIVPLKLILSGTVVRASASDAAATIGRYEFRTRTTDPLPSPAI